MLIKYKSAFRKIAMGLLSYMPDLKEIKSLQDTIQTYENDDRYKLYLWKKEEDVVGVIGYYEKEQGEVELQHVGVNPSYRHEGIGAAMVTTLEERLNKTFSGTAATKPFLDNCKNRSVHSEGERSS